MCDRSIRRQFSELLEFLKVFLSILYFFFQGDYRSSIFATSHLRKKRSLFFPTPSPNRFSLGFTWLNLKWNPLSTLMIVFSGPAGGRPAGFDWADMKTARKSSSILSLSLPRGHLSTPLRCPSILLTLTQLRVLLLLYCLMYASKLPAFPSVQLICR